MADIYSKRKRSLIMATVKSKNTKPEILLRSALFVRGFRFRNHVKELSGKPDIVLRKYKTLIFVNGCFWHGHHCKSGTLPKSNLEFWTKKINQNVLRDRRNYRYLRRSGWKVIIVWQCQFSSLEKMVTKIVNQILTN